jgi:polyisoprenoid-binding protein YceI
MSTFVETREALPTGTWQLDPVHSHVAFAVDYLVGTFRGSFSPVDATLESRENREAILTGSTRVEDVKVQDENLEAHLQSPDFFDAERAPEIRFTSNRVRRSGDDVTIAGELTIKGESVPVELTGTITEPATDPYGRERFGLKLETTIDRTQFGITWNNPLPSGEPALADDVTLAAELSLVKAA